MTKTVTIKFRATTRLKSAVEQAADRRDTSVSALLRSAAQQIAAGRAADGGVRADMVKVRQAANAVLALVGEGATPNSESLARAANAAETLRQIAGRHLGPVS